MSHTLRSFAVVRDDVPAGVVALPVRTRLVKPGDDLTALVADAVNGIARAGDVIAVSETAVAIAQREFVVAEHVRPSRLAYFLCRCAGPMATLSQPESVQLVIDRVGWAMVLWAAIVHAVARLLGRRGGLYFVLGDAVAAIDGYTGTMPPYERAIVLAPRDPAGFARSLHDRTGIESVVVDANDLGSAKVLGASDGVATESVTRGLLDNPHGNGDEQTPVVVLKWRGTGPNPLLARDAA